MPTALALSPHLDDAVFSCGATLAKLTAEGWDVRVATVFTRSVLDPAGFALECQTSKGLPPEADYMAIRRAEDAAAVDALGLPPPLFGDLPEAPHRGFESAAELFDPDRDPGDAAEAAAVIRGWLADVRPDLLLTCAGLGGHADHRLLIRALTTLAGLPETARYLDTPYALRAGESELGAAAGTRAWLAVDVADHLDAKLNACAAYATQLPFQFGGEGAMRRRLRDAAVSAAGTFEYLFGSPSGPVGTPAEGVPLLSRGRRAAGD